MIIVSLSLFLFVIIFILSSSLVIIGFNYKPKILPSGINLNPDLGSQKPSCLNNNISCILNSDCKTLCSEDIDFECITLNRNKDQAGNFGTQKSICKPALPQQTCNLNTGGLWVWTGNSESETQGWDCICSYPSYYGNPQDGCSSLNKGICENGTFTYDAFTQQGPPTGDNCVCNDGYTKLLAGPLNGEYPVCVPTNIQSYYSY